MTHSIIKKSQLEGALRLDAEYYQPEYLSIKKKVAVHENVRLLKDVASIITGPAYSSEAMGSNFGIPLARIGDITNKTDINDWIQLSEKEFKKFNNRGIKNLDILMTMTGDPPDVGKCNLISVTGNRLLAFNQRVAKLTAKISPYYLFAYLSTEFARLQTERNGLGIRQRNIGINDIRNIQVVLFSDDHLSIINHLAIAYFKELENSKLYFLQAENLLLEELGLEDWIPYSAKGGQASGNDIAWSVNLSEVQKANRMDAEYFQPKYEKVMSVISSNNGIALSELATVKKGFEPGSEAYEDEGKLFIRVSSLTKQGLIGKDQKCLNDKLYQELKKDYEPKVGEILVTKDASPGIAYVVKESVEGIISGGIVRLKLKEKNIEPEYLSLCINSIVGQSQVERDAGGSIIKHWKPEQIKEMQIPILPNGIQQKIADLVRRSHEARKKAKELLEEAKCKVEELIEERN